MISELQHIEATIRDAALEEFPFPHIAVHDVLPPSILQRALGRWPRRMSPEPGELGRYMSHLINGAAPGTTYGRFPAIRYWERFARSVGKTIVGAAFDRFRKYNDCRFGADATYHSHLMLFESGPNFSQHHAHTHHNFGPGWAMTFLFFLDDGDRTDRGEVFSAPTREANWLDVVALGPAPVKPLKRIPFRPNTLLAWLDGPMSFHGTDELARDPVNRRRMLRCHARAAEPVVARSLGVDSNGFFKASQEHLIGKSESLRAILAKPGNCIEALPRFSFAV
jgi:hypothetical protein